MPGGSRPLYVECAKQRLEPKSTMSCRIERLLSGDNSVIFCISRRIRAQDVKMIRDLLAQERHAVAIDLKYVDVVDNEVVSITKASERNSQTAQRAVQREPHVGSKQSLPD
jgi:hypothetical protein